MKTFRLLTPDEIECRVSRVNSGGVSLLLYKTARTDADLLDETFGADRWANDFKIVDGVLYGGIGIDYAGDGHLVWKWDAGTESNTEAEKGRASDAFKRAGFKHGIGRELYSAPDIFVPASLVKITNGKCYEKFEVASIAYDDNEHISDISITVQGREVYRMGKTAQISHESFAKAREEKAKESNGFTPTCASCGATITDKVHDYSVKKFGKPLCMDCQKKA